MLTMEWVEGVRLTDVSVMRAWDRPERSPRSRRARVVASVAERGIHARRSASGNLLVARNGGLTYLDFGMTVEVPIETRRAMIRGLVGFVNRDARGLVDDLKAMDFLPSGSPSPRRRRFASSFGRERVQSCTSNDFMGVVSQLSTALMKHGFRLPPYFSRILRALAALEGRRRPSTRRFAS